AHGSPACSTPATSGGTRPGRTGLPTPPGGPATCRPGGRACRTRAAEAHFTRRFTARNLRLAPITQFGWHAGNRALRSERALHTLRSRPRTCLARDHRPAPAAPRDGRRCRGLPRLALAGRRRAVHVPAALGPGRGRAEAAGLGERAVRG